MREDFLIIKAMEEITKGKKINRFDKTRIKTSGVRNILNKTRRQMTKAGENICNRYDKGLLSLI